MKPVQFFLGFCALVWLPYGVLCFLQPGFLDEAAGLVAQTATGSTELRAMYGGLQAGIGALMLAAIFRADLRVPALVCLAFLCSGLALARFSGAWLDAGFSAYTIVGLGFEIVLASLALLFLRNSSPPAPA